MEECLSFRASRLALKPLVAYAKAAAGNGVTNAVIARRSLFVLFVFPTSGRQIAGRCVKTRRE
jgi:predicted RNA-binding Zn-ribbon protein involved in translation (DUF1610 family)